MRRNMEEWRLQIANSAKRQAMPIMTYPGLQVIKKSILDVIQDSRTQYESISALANKYPSIAAVTFIDSSVEAEAFGSPVKFSVKDVPTVKTGIISDKETAQNLKIPKVGVGRTSVYIRAAELAAENINDRPTFGGHIGPFSLTNLLFSTSEVMIGLMNEPEKIHLVLEKCTQFLIEYAKAFKLTGANGIIINEPAAGLISPKQCEEFSSQYVKRIVDAVQDDFFMVILHNCGNAKPLIPLLLSTGAVGLHFGNFIDMGEILPQIPENRLAFGNIDPVQVLKNGSVNDVKTEVWLLLEKMAPYKNFVLSSGCDIPPGTPLENVEDFFDTLEWFNCNNT
jgi:uroporphyrinogen decarboxylase